MNTTAPGPVDLLTRESVPGYLVDRGLLRRGVPVRVRELSGGVSNVVLGVDHGNHHWVVKQSLPRLRVAQQWFAKRERTANEANGLLVAGRITPQAVPGVVALDPERWVLVVQRAPEGTAPWKGDLLAGRADARVGARLGEVLGQWHAVSSADPSLSAVVDDPELFEQLRVTPYHRAVAAELPECRDAIMSVVRRMVGRRQCLVHGDFSPKNILVGPGTVMVIDFEVAHRGDPAFDVAFLCCHLLLKMVHRPSAAAAYRDVLLAFLHAYHTAAGASGLPAIPAAELHTHVGCLLLARTDGRSPVEYLSDGQRASVRRLGRSLLLTPPGRTAEVFDLFGQELRR